MRLLLVEDDAMIGGDGPRAAEARAKNAMPHGNDNDDDVKT